MRLNFLLMCMLILAASQFTCAQIILVGNAAPKSESQAKKDTAQSVVITTDTIKPHQSKISPSDPTAVSKASSQSVTPSHTPNKQTIPQEETGKTSIGVGMGFDYGGLFGINASLYPSKNFGVFGGLGYAIIGVGYNVGAKLRFGGKNSHAYPFVEFMYGYNAVIRVVNAESLNKMFYGPTLGIGWDNMRNDKGFSFALLIPFRGSSVSDYEQLLKTKYGATITQELLPIAFSIGYKWYFN